MAYFELALPVSRLRRLIMVKRVKFTQFNLIFWYILVRRGLRMINLDQINIGKGKRFLFK